VQSTEGPWNAIRSTQDVRIYAQVMWKADGVGIINSKKGELRSYVAERDQRDRKWRHPSRTSRTPTIRKRLWRILHLAL